MASKLSEADQGGTSESVHRELYVYISRHLTRGVHGYLSFITITRACLPPAKLANPENITDILEALETENWIAIGDYKNLIIILADADLHQVKEEVKRRGTEIEDLVKKEGKSVTIVKDIPESLRLHYKLYEHVSSQLNDEMPEYQSFLTITRTFLSRGKLAQNRKYVVDILIALQSANWITIGNYTSLIKLLEDASQHALKGDIETKEIEIQGAMKKEGEDLKAQNVKEIPENLRHHCKLFEHVNRHLPKKTDEFRSFRTIASGYIPGGKLPENNAVEVLWALESEGAIAVGNYDVLLKILDGAKLKKLEGEIRQRASVIQKMQNMKDLPDERTLKARTYRDEWDRYLGLCFSWNYALCFPRVCSIGSLIYFRMINQYMTHIHSVLISSRVLIDLYFQDKIVGELQQLRQPSRLKQDRVLLQMLKRFYST